MMIVKIGGGDSIHIQGIVSDLTEVKEKLIIVHGANATRDKLAKDLGWEKKVLTSVSGYSSVYSDERTIDLQMMAYAGLRNKRIVELCQQRGIQAVGLSGLDGQAIRGIRNKGIRIREEGKLKIVRDFSGKPASINKSFLDLLLENGYTPVLSIPILDENQFAINSENDDIINVLQEAYRAERILQLIEAPGFLEDKNDPDSIVSKISKEELAVRESQVEGRMKRKILALRKLFESGAGTVIIADGRTEHPVLDALNGKGTLIQ
jgi:acetylglutamate/LysW-gamma-L-alpha-aminoadipate kinase